MPSAAVLSEWKVPNERLDGTSPKGCAISIAKSAPVIEGAVLVSGNARTQASGETSDAMPSEQPSFEPRLLVDATAPTTRSACAFGLEAFHEERNCASWLLIASKFDASPQKGVVTLSRVGVIA